LSLKKLLIIGALAAAIALLGQKTSHWIEAPLHDNGAATGSAFAEMQATFTQREVERRQEVQSAAQAAEERKRQQLADQAAHQAVMDEIERLRTLEGK
jgi:ATP:corrinoid adenosyltransferase